MRQTVSDFHPWCPIRLPGEPSRPYSPAMEQYLALVLAGLVVVALLAWLTLSFRRWWMARRLGERMDRAADGEQLAERWLVAQGYTILERQATRRCVMHINDRVAEFDVRADLLVALGDERLLVEVKTGEVADPRVPQTRRQLREYAALFEVDAVAVFDATRQRLYRVVFPES